MDDHDVGGGARIVVHSAKDIGWRNVDVNGEHAETASVGVEALTVGAVTWLAPPAER
ncbi:hypothetical protein ACIBCN_21715 [Nocardia sp. NPDC051052]|uniref:hypothetical protein n=1 Tax=Nocardia sp. NPDC051052 TaxID=3364322 RepID=UPI00379EBAB1